MLHCQGLVPSGRRELDANGIDIGKLAASFQYLAFECVGGCNNDTIGIFRKSRKLPQIYPSIYDNSVSSCLKRPRLDFEVAYLERERWQPRAHSHILLECPGHAQESHSTYLCHSSHCTPNSFSASFLTYKRNYLRSYKSPPSSSPLAKSHHYRSCQ
jgi:hypothetical protein